MRYIAINDGVDTAREDNEFTPLRNWFNEFYARDTSKKIRAVKQAKAQKGERVNGEVPYGYIADPNDRNHLLPDPETAHIVKQIFAMYVRGDRICEIQNCYGNMRYLLFQNCATVVPAVAATRARTRPVFITGRIRHCMIFLDAKNIWGIPLRARAIRYLTNRKRRKRTRRKSNTFSPTRTNL